MASLPALCLRPEKAPFLPALMMLSIPASTSTADNCPSAPYGIKFVTVPLMLTLKNLKKIHVCENKTFGDTNEAIPKSFFHIIYLFP